MARASVQNSVGKINIFVRASLKTDVLMDVFGFRQNKLFPCGQNQSESKWFCSWFHSYYRQSLFNWLEAPASAVLVILQKLKTLWIMNSQLRKSWNVYSPMLTNIIYETVTKITGSFTKHEQNNMIKYVLLFGSTSYNKKTACNSPSVPIQFKGAEWSKE